MAKPDRGRRWRAWRLRLDESTILEVTASRGATEKQVRRRGRMLVGLATLLAMLGFGTVLAYADAITGVSITVKGSEATDTYTKSTAVKVAILAAHCPPGGDMSAIEVSLRNSTSDSWTIVKADGAAWPAGNCSGGVAPSTPAEFDWTLAAGTDGARTVYAKLRHGTNETLADDSIILDTIAPTIADLGFAGGTLGSNGWYTSAVDNKFSASDAGSGLSASCQAAFAENGTTTYGERTVSTGASEGSAITVGSGPCSDVAGNSNAGVDSSAYMIDLSDPTVAITAPADGSSTSSSSATVSGAADDAISGIDTVDLVVNGSPLGSNATYDSGEKTWSQSDVALQCGANTITARATDVAGRQTESAEISVTRNCVSYVFTGFYSPVDPENVAKAGQGVPLKWNLYDGSVALVNEVVDPVVGSGHYTLSSAKISCSLVGSGDSVPTADDAGSSGLHYDYFDAPTSSAHGQNVFVWKTLKDWANTCRRFSITYGGATLSAEFRFTK